MATSTLHSMSKAVKPGGDCKSTTYWAAVLLLDKDLLSPKLEEDFLWVKCKHKHTVDTIREQYKNTTGIDVDLVLPGVSTSSLQSSMKDLDSYGDHLITFQAVRRNATIPGRQPLQLLGQNPQRRASPTEPEYIPLLKEEKTDQANPIHAPWNTEHPVLPAIQQPPQPGTTQITGYSCFKDMARANWILAHLPVDEADLEAKCQQAWDKMTPDFKEKFQQSAIRIQLSLGSTSAVSRNPLLQDTLLEEVGKSELSLGEPFTGGADSSDPNEASGVPLDLFQLQDLIANVSLEVLESCVETGVDFLNDLKRPLKEKPESSDAAQWVEQIERLQAQATKARTIIGVVGNTGAGKSSVINAMLDEERLVPTNTMRACTAVVTELSYNDKDGDAYRAEIEFITVADWQKDLTCLYQDLIDGNGDVSRDCTNAESDAGIAYAKIKAVFPKMTREDICNSSVAILLEDPNVSRILGTCKNIESDDSLRFYKMLQKYVDSKEKATGKSNQSKGNQSKERKEPKEMEYWPLIKVVRIFVKSPALATGAVIVDLPGVHDANAARAAVAESYMKQCTGLWIVAPIIRAVDDKAAKNLLGESFKRQLKMDGGFNSVTFVCSKTDDISLMEASDSLGLEEVNGPAWAELDSHVAKQRSLKKEIESLQESKATYGDVMGDVDDQLEKWEAIKDDFENGETVFAPLTKKRKRMNGEEGQSRKKRNRQEDQDDGFTASDSDESVDGGKTEGNYNAEEDEDRAPLTEEQITAKIFDLRTMKKEARRQRVDLENKIKETKKQVAAAKDQEQKIEANISKVCIEGRNAYSKGAIQLDFAAGMKELDQEIAAEDDEEAFNPDVDIRDYDEVARSLPVFCVSSRGYQKLQGRLTKDPPVPGFTTLEQTEIPQLQAHCKSLTVAGRTANCKRFMTNLSQLLNSMIFWVSSDGTNVHLTANQKENAARFLQKSLEDLEIGLEGLVQAIIKDLAEDISNCIFDRYDAGTTMANDESMKTCMHWGAKVNRDNRAAGGYFYASYKALCRRNGLFTNAQGLHDWNNQLCEPFMKAIAHGWETAFSRRCPTILGGLSRNADKLLQAFHMDVNGRAQKIGAGLAGLPMLQQQLHVYGAIFKDCSATTRASINAQQKEINREFVPVIEKFMLPAYQVCTDESGIGSYMRMKDAMESHVDEKRHIMFRASADEVRRLIKEMLRLVEEDMLNKVEEVCNSMSRDYRTVLGGGDISEDEVMPRWQRILHGDVKAIIDKAEKIFKRIAGIEVEGDLKGLEDGSQMDEDAEGQKMESTTMAINPENSGIGDEQLASPLGRLGGNVEREGDNGE